MSLTCDKGWVGFLPLYSVLRSILYKKREFVIVILWENIIFILFDLFVVTTLVEIT